jgi:cell division protein FtsL
MSNTQKINITLIIITIIIVITRYICVTMRAEQVNNHSQ